MGKTREPEEVIREEELGRFDGGLSFKHRDRLVRLGRYPKPLKLSDRRRVWLKSEIRRFQDEAIRERNEGRPKRVAPKGFERKKVEREARNA